MKKLWIILLASLGLSVFFYISNGQALTVRYHIEKELVNEKQIISEIEIPLANLVTGIVERDAPLIFGIFSDPINSRYVREGAIYKSISSAEKQYAKWFEDQDHSIKRLFKFKRKEYDIISPTTVLFTGIGVLEKQVIAYTIVWVLETDGWKAINMHISWK